MAQSMGPYRSTIRSSDRMAAAPTGLQRACLADVHLTIQIQLARGCLVPAQTAFALDKSISPDPFVPRNVTPMYPMWK